MARNMTGLANLTAEDRAAGLAKAGEIRKARAQVKADLAAGKISMADVIEHRDDPVYGRIYVSQALDCLPGFGAATVKKTMDEIGIASGRRIAGLGRHQIDKLLARFA